MSINASDYGMSPTASAPDNLVALKAAIEATPPGGTLIIPEGTYTIDVTGGLSNAAVIEDRMTLQIDGTISANAFAIQPNPFYILWVKAKDVVFSGHGTLAGNGQIDDTNSGDVRVHPGLVYVTGDNFVFGEQLTIATPPKVGVALVKCRNARIGGTWKGGVAKYCDTTYFGVLATGGGDHVFEGIDARMGDDIASFTYTISGGTTLTPTFDSGTLVIGNMIAGDGIRAGTRITGVSGGTYTLSKPQTVTSGRGHSGRMFVNFIFTGGYFGDANNCTVRNCHADVWEKLLYGHGSGHYVHDNRGQGYQTTWIRLEGPNSRAYRNKCAGAAGGVTAYDGTDIEICDNTFTDCGQVGISVERLNGATVAGSINGNVLTVTSVTSGKIEIGQFVHGAEVDDGTQVLDGPAAGLTGTYTVTNSQVRSARVLAIGYASGFGGLKISGNVLLGDSTAYDRANGIQFIADGSDTSGVVIANNRVENFGTKPGQALIKAQAVSPFAIANLTITHNQIGQTSKSGIVADRVVDSVIEGNVVMGNSGDPVLPYMLNEIGGARNRWIGNSIRSTGYALGINGLSTTSDASGNRYTDAPLSGTRTLGAGASSTIPHGGIAPNAKIFIAPANAAFGTMIAAKGWPVVTQSNGNLVVTSANGTPFDGTEACVYTIVQ
ncbi:hypothetical protein MZO42_08125 [Sphingomonas psychrotolerans]|uniref:Right handed beta helix domain-containing protein n=1 Tax=Sphingomonas psychrotolerans TaxID=1327635 RepID=A0ABU3N2F6_9SPHN|nr:hypothetical protein [Sphingomonas psychrotolerans]MDT8758662.1 hypothetical protein [Sphingomonas psychrotolerans]